MESRQQLFGDRLEIQVHAAAPLRSCIRIIREEQRARQPAP